MPFLEIGGVQPDIIHNIRESSRVERPRPQVAHELRFYLLDNLTPLPGQISAQVLGAELLSLASLAMPISCLMLYHLPRNNAP